MFVCGLVTLVVLDFLGSVLADDWLCVVSSLEA